ASLSRASGRSGRLGNGAAGRSAAGRADHVGSGSFAAGDDRGVHGAAGMAAAGTGRMIAALKFIHIAGLAGWCAALIALPLLMHAHGRAGNQRQYARFRLVTHIGYIGFATPAALITIIAGTGLIFAAQVLTPGLLV